MPKGIPMGSTVWSASIKSLNDLIDWYGRNRRWRTVRSRKRGESERVGERRGNTMNVPLTIRRETRFYNWWDYFLSTIIAAYPTNFGFFASQGWYRLFPATFIARSGIRPLNQSVTVDCLAPENWMRRSISFVCSDSFCDVLHVCSGNRREGW